MTQCHRTFTDHPFAKDDKVISLEEKPTKKKTAIKLRTRTKILWSSLFIIDINLAYSFEPFADDTNLVTGTCHGLVLNLNNQNSYETITSTSYLICF